jgi:hypothetical protein
MGTSIHTILKDLKRLETLVQQDGGPNEEERLDIATECQSLYPLLVKKRKGLASTLREYGQALEIWNGLYHTANGYLRELEELANLQGIITPQEETRRIEQGRREVWSRSIY